MARGGIYKGEVVRARARLLAQGRYPSIDAVRAELGDTGSKSTIHRYLKEIEEEEGGSTGSKVAIGDALQDLVGRLAARLQDESDQRIAEATAKHQAQAEEYAATVAGLRNEAAELRTQLERLQCTLAEERNQQEEMRLTLNNEAVAKAHLTQQIGDLQERLAGEERHRQSLEEKHQHARESLEHFRQSIKEQREQDQRQHEQQAQYFQGEIRTLKQSLTGKQGELIHSNQENLRLANELSTTASRLRQAETELRALGSVKEALGASQQRAADFEGKLLELGTALSEANEAKHALESHAGVLAQTIRHLELTLAAERAAAASREQIGETIKRYLAPTAPN